MLKFSSKVVLRITAGAALGLALSACGGDGARTDDTPAVVPPAKVTLGGVAAVGAPIVGGNIEWKCNSGATGGAVTDAAGAWAGQLVDADFPCVITVKNGTAGGELFTGTLLSAADAAGLTNITPLTTLGVAVAAQASVTDLYVAYFARPADAGTGTPSDPVFHPGSAIFQSVFSRPSLAEASSQVLGVINDGLASMGGTRTPFDVFRTPFAAALGDPMDDLLEVFGAATRAAGLTLGDVAAHAVAGTKLTQEAHTVTAFTTPDLRTFAAGWSKNLDGKEIFSVPDLLREKYLAGIASRDLDGNITALASGGPFSGVTSLLGNRVGSLCAEDKSGPNVKSRSQYVYVASELTEVDPSELFGKTFRDYEDCVDSGSTVVDANGMAIFTATGDQANAPEDFKQLFTAAGLEQIQPSGTSVSRAKAYKYTDGGDITYVYVLVSSLKGSKEPRINGDTDYTLIGIASMR